MKILLLHSKIIADTVTKSFIASFEGGLVPKLCEKYGTSLSEIQLYEDYLGDGFVRDGEFYYPLTLVLDGEVTRQWIKWNFSEKKKFKGQNPFTYLSEEPLEIHLCDEAPEEFSRKLLGRASYFEEGLVPLSVEANLPDTNFLIGKFSQTFVDELTRQIHNEIMKKCSVRGLADSGVELSLVFAPNTFMEHIAENTTYRRLLIKARGCNARDLWIKWTRLNSITPFTVSNNVFATDVKFEIAEDVPEKFREREYRYLASESGEKYQISMGRKNITEWRELIKRCIKRGELIKCEAEKEAVKEETNELAAKLQEALSGYTPTTVPEVSEREVDDSSITNLLRSVLAASEDVKKESALPAEPEALNEEVLDEPPFEIDEPIDIDNSPEEPVQETSPEALKEPCEVIEETAKASTESEDELRARLEAEIREKLLAELSMKAEEEKEELLKSQRELLLENERLMEIARKAEEERIANEEKLNSEAEKLRLEAEAREQAEARERAKIEEAARQALIEEQRLLERRALEEAAEAERLRLQEEENRRIEAERLERERAEAEIKAEEPKPTAPRYTYVSKNARLLFRRQVDPNITKRIHEIILTTIKYFHKEDIFIKIKATIPDSTTVNLHFEKIPEEETELLINIIKVLGKSDLGITKVFLE